MEKGVALGKRKGQAMICFKMNLPMEEIQKHTGLSVEEIEAFRKEMEQQWNEGQSSQGLFFFDVMKFKIRDLPDAVQQIKGCSINSVDESIC